MVNSLAIFFVAGWCWLVLFSLPSAHADDEQRLQKQFDSTIKPMLKEKCGDCHWGVEATAGLGFDRYSRVEQVLDSHRRWEKVVEELKKKNMPPEDAEPLTQQDRALIIKWIDETLALVDCSTVRPGSVTIRRLNGIEYRNSVRDLLGVDYAPAADFPGDDVGYGFDNIADVMSLPPILMEKYLDAGEAIATRAIVDPDNPLVDVKLAAIGFHGNNEFTSTDQGVLSMYTNDTATKRVTLPMAGEYTVDVIAYGDQAGPEPVRMSLLLDDQLLDTVDVESKLRKPSTHRFIFQADVSAEHDLKIRFENDFLIDRKIGRQDRNLHVTEVHVRGPLLESTNDPQRPWLKLDVEDEPGSAQFFIQGFVRAAFRRTLDETDVSRFSGLYNARRNEGLSFYESIRIVTQAVLVSPEFLFRFEQPAENGIRELNGFELATALSYFLWSSTPDDELLSLAADNRLSDPEVFGQQASRLLASPRSEALVENFASQWLNLRLLASLQPDAEQFPDVNGELLADMQTETRMVVADIFRRDASILELLDSEFTFVNDRLARHYGIEVVIGDNNTAEFRKIKLAGSGRLGVLTHASILTLTSNPDRTSPVKRGKWLMENILGDEPPPPLAEIKPLDDQTELTGTLRERMEQHRADPSCASCHATMDALGFAMENYDAVGRFRLLDEGLQIDAVSELPDGTRLDGAQGLQQQLRTTYRDKFVRCFTEKLLVYALGRGLRYYDRCAVEQIMEQAESQDFRLSAFIHAIVVSETYRKRSPHDPQND